MIKTAEPRQKSSKHPNPQIVERPQGLRLIRQLKWILDPVNYLEATKEKLPDFFEDTALGFGEGPLIITSHPEALQFILSRDSHSGRQSQRTLFYSPGELNSLLAPLIGNSGVIMLSGDRHKERRQLVAPAFHGDRLVHYGQLICDLTHQIVTELDPGTPFIARTLTQKVSLKTISSVVFGFTDGPRSQEITKVLTEAVDLFSSPISALLLFFTGLQKDLGPWSPWGRFVRKQQQLDELIYAEIRDRRANPNANRQDILSMLMAARTEDGEALEEKELRDELMTLLMAGHETTATSIAWAMYWTHKQPDVKAKLLAELDSLGPTASPTEIAALPYLTAVCKETLRRSPVAMFTFPRIAKTEVNIMGRAFPAETLFLGCMFLTHQREDLYPDHTAFRPERFLERKYSPYEFIAFGNGSRRCVGEALAQYEMKLALATLLSHYQFSLASKAPEKPRRRGVTLAPANGVPMIFQGKRDASATS